MLSIVISLWAGWPGFHSCQWLEFFSPCYHI